MPSPLAQRSASLDGATSDPAVRSSASRFGITGDTTLERGFTQAVRRNAEFCGSTGMEMSDMLEQARRLSDRPSVPCSRRGQVLADAALDTACDPGQIGCPNCRRSCRWSGYRPAWPAGPVRRRPSTVPRSRGDWRRTRPASRPDRASPRLGPNMRFPWVSETPVRSGT